MSPHPVLLLLPLQHGAANSKQGVVVGSLALASVMVGHGIVLAVGMPGIGRIVAAVATVVAVADADADAGVGAVAVAGAGAAGTVGAPGIAGAASTADAAIVPVVIAAASAAVVGEHNSPAHRYILARAEGMAYC
eukprot:CAMPEP_0184522702 /NCGR_PEP_ID=MMETSP0198_2-20121128/8430_1 /TAXON_ID=1112570 /ORGANISM="Thraustochytrium sp., Strain LLF1b" /LENGTH=134 /DNA_ID=CAMNT_0026913561 /DNA_START=1279 /DNA_END=1683 /DNA_ORIENTATION=-